MTKRGRLSGRAKSGLGRCHDVGAEIDAERARYAIRPSLSEVVGQFAERGSAVAEGEAAADERGLEAAAAASRSSFPDASLAGEPGCAA